MCGCIKIIPREEFDQLPASIDVLQVLTKIAEPAVILLV